jgi:hypothetical protein
MTMNILIWVVGTLVAGSVVTSPAAATMIMAFSVEEMAQRADKIFVGSCLKTEHSVTDQGVPVLEVSFAVHEAIKGTIAGTVTFRQIDPTSQGLTSGPGLWSAASLAGVPTYLVGEEVLLFLAEESGFGLTAPVGLFQGKMPVTATAAGKKVITNQALKSSKRVSVPLPEPGQAAAYDQFIAALRTITQPAQ